MNNRAFAVSNLLLLKRSLDFPSPRLLVHHFSAKNLSLLSGVKFYFFICFANWATAAESLIASLFVLNAPKLALTMPL